MSFTPALQRTCPSGDSDKADLALVYHSLLKNGQLLGILRVRATGDASIWPSPDSNEANMSTAHPLPMYQPTDASPLTLSPPTVVVVPPLLQPTAPAETLPVAGQQTIRRPGLNAPAPEPPTITLRVLHLVNGEHFAGAERVQSHLGRCLPQQGITADFACLKPGRFADAADAAGDWGKAIRFPMRNRFDLSIVHKLTRAVRAGDYSLLHAHTPRTAMIAAIVSKLAQVPWVYHVHSPAARDSSRRVRNWLNAKIESQAIKSCSHLITVSESLRQDLLAKGETAERVTVVHNGVPGIRYTRSSYPQVGGKWTFGMVALMRPRKGLEVALDAIAILRKQNYDVNLRCIGPYESDEYRRRIEAQIASLGIKTCVEQSGFKKDVPATLSQIDAMLLPSLYGEGLPMVVLEAMASALPVIATKVEGTPEAIRDRIDGLLAEPGSAESLASQMRDLIDGTANWSSLAESAYRRHAELFSDVAMSAGVAAVYRKVTVAARV
jgi:glycosyltransferase involved in cell wall biosynthesis